MKGKTIVTGLLGFMAILTFGGCTNSSGSNQPVVGGPPAGHYVCRAGGYNKLYSGEFDIKPNGQYVGIERRGGNFSYDPQKKTLVFTTGDFEYWDFIAVYQSAAESGEGRERLVLKDESAESPIGQERPGEYQYCYMVQNNNNVSVSRDSGTTLPGTGQY